MKLKNYNYYNSNKKQLLEVYKKIGLINFIKKLAPYFADIFILVFPFLKKKRYFRYNSKKIRYFYHKYNKTWKNERAIEIPIFLDFIKKSKSRKILEIGNVMNHYFPFKHSTLDKYESYPGVINEDLLNFYPGIKYDFIFSISTFEHIGVHDYPIDYLKSIKAIKHTIKNLLAKKGKFIISFPVNYNPALTKMINNNKIKNYRLIYFKKADNSKNLWYQCNYLNASGRENKQPMSEFIILEMNKKTRIK